MRELERAPSPAPPRDPAPTIAVVGAGRLGTLLAGALRDAGRAVEGPLRRGEIPGADAGIVLLCVGDEQIAAAAAAVPTGPLVGHCSGATTLEPLGARPAFSLHPLMTVPPGAAADVLRGAGAAVEGSDPDALAAAEGLARDLGLVPLAIAPGDRPAYHAAASIAANFLITVEAAAERLGASVGLERAQLVPLVRAAVDNWAALGPRRALTGPLARGDEATVARQREAVSARAPELLELFDGLAAATRRLAAEGAPC